MGEASKHDSWSAGENYEHYMGRWSRLISYEFLNWLDAPRNADWLDIGCGTGALTQTILNTQFPRSVVGIEPSESFLEHARATTADHKVSFQVAGAEALPLTDNSVDVATSALVLNFVPNKTKMMEEMRRVTRQGGVVSFYVWDYPSGGIGFIDAYWKAAAAVDPAAKDLDESDRFPYCTRDGLSEICISGGLSDPDIETFEVDAEFPDFDAFWQPFTLGAGPAPGHCMSLSEEKRREIRVRLADELGTDNPISLPARAFGVKATVHH